MKTIDNILKFLYGSLFFLTPLTFTSNTSELFEFNKMIFIYLVTVLIVLFWLTKMIVTKKIIFKKTSLDIPILLFLGSQVLSTFFSIDRHTSLFGYYGRFNGGLSSIVSYIILYYGFVSNFINVDFTLKASLFSSVLVMLYGLPGKLGHDLTCFFVSGGKMFDNSCWSTEANVFNPSERVFSTLGQPNWLGAYLAINFFIGIYFLIKNSKNTQYSILYTLYLFSNFSFILFSRSRSALLAACIGILLFVISYWFLVRKELKRFIITLLIITVIPIVLFKTGIEKVDRFITNPVSIFKPPNSPPASKTQPPISNTAVTESADIRKIVWKGAIDLGFKYPLFGTGVETFAYSYNFVRPIEHNLTSEWDFVYNKAHNEFLNYLATTGFVGLGTYLILIFTFIFFVFFSVIPLKKGIQNSLIPAYAGMTKNKNETVLKISLLISYVTILITNFFGFSTTTINLFFYLIPGFVTVLVSERNERIQNLKVYNEQVRLTIFQWLLIFVVSGVSIYFTYSTFVYWLADTYYAQGSNYSKPQISDYQKATAYFEKALKIRREPVYEDRFSSSLSYLSAFAAYQKQSDLASQLIRLSDYYNEGTLAKYPKNIFYWKTKAKNQYLFYQVTSDPDYLFNGVEALKNSKKIAPTDPKIPYSLSVYYSMLYDAEKNSSQKELWKRKSISEINLALELKKDFQDGLTLKKDLQSKYSMD